MVKRQSPRWASQKVNWHLLTPNKCLAQEGLCPPRVPEPQAGVGGGGEGLGEEGVSRFPKGARLALRFQVLH